MAEQSYTDAIAVLKADHRKVEDLFEQFEKAGGAAAKRKLAQQICLELKIHTMIEEEMYGMTFSANRLKRFRAPPENMLNMSTMVPCWASINCSMAWGSMPGTGM